MMKLIHRFIFTLALFGTIVSSAQQKSDQILLTIGTEKIPTSEFVRIYLKNNQVVSVTDRKSVEDYLDLFINFKLKVIEATNQKLDTSASYRNELAGYRQQLARPYMIDKETEQRIINEAYERMKLEISVSHIMISVPEQALPSDTLKLYEKAIAIRNRIINGESFEVVARATSDDHSVINNNGLLGYFTVFQMVYPFESAAYSLKVGELSMPVRTRFGYHIIKVNDKRPARGQVKVAHIMIASSKDATPEQQTKAKEKIQDIYKQVLNNEDFGKLASKFSEDPGSSKNNGELPLFSTGGIVSEFEKIAFGFDHDGQISEPFQTPFGWHIVKRLGRKEIGSLDDMLPDIKKKLSSDMRNAISVEKMIAKIKNENNFKEDTLSLRQIDQVIDSSIYRGKWSLPNLKENKNLFVIADQKFGQSEFAKYLFSYQQNPLKGSFHYIVRKAYKDWVNQTIYDYQISVLDQKYPEFKYLLQEYHDGILLFNISDINVWSKASNDSIGLENYFKNHLENYKWGERVHYLAYSCQDNSLLEKARKSIINQKVKSSKPEEIIAKLNKGKTQIISFTKLVANPDENDVSDYKKWVGGISPIINQEGKYMFKELLEVTTGDIKAINDCKGQVVSDYQQLLEEEWLKSLHQKYPVEINKEAFKLVVDDLGKK